MKRSEAAIINVFISIVVIATIFITHNYTEQRLVDRICDRASWLISTYNYRSLEQQDETDHIARECGDIKALTNKEYGQNR